jgi:glucose/arabinose dehydrogenase
VTLTPLPGGPIDHHWTKSLTASRDGSLLYVGVGSNSNITENGVEAEKKSSCDLGSGSRERTLAHFCERPSQPEWTNLPESGVLWTVVNERDELGPNLVPDYLTSVKDGAFYGWLTATTVSTLIRACSRNARIWSRRRSLPTTR